MDEDITKLLSPYRCILVPIARNATGSMTYVLKQFRSNYTSKEIRDNIDEIEWKNRIKFAFVRHPLDRFISAIAQANAPHIGIRINSGIEGPSFNYHIFRPQVEYLTEDIDFVGKYENLEEDWKKVNNLIGIDLPLIHSNETEAKRKLTKEEIEWAIEYYKEDFKRFKYKINAKNYSIHN